MPWIIFPVNGQTSGEFSLTMIWVVDESTAELVEALKRVRNKRNWDFWFSSRDEVVKTNCRSIVDESRRVDGWSIRVVVSTFSMQDISLIDSGFFSIVIVVEMIFSGGLWLTLDSLGSLRISAFASGGFSTSVGV
jgi:hypothetical protein